MSLHTAKVDAIKAVKPERHGLGSQPIHPYFGKLDPALARELIMRFSKTNDLILDPFCGSGSVLPEALLNSRSVLGWDSSQLALLLSSAKTVGILPPEEKELLRVKAKLESYLQSDSLFTPRAIPTCPAPPMPRVHDVSTWFQPNAFRELSFLKFFVSEEIKQISPAATILLKTAFSRIITAASNQQGESSYRRVSKSDTPGRVLGLFNAALSAVISTAKKYQILFEKAVPTDGPRTVCISDLETYTSWGKVFAQISHQDARSAGITPTSTKKRPSLVVTSPPYLMSWDYGLYHKFRFYWLGFDLDTYEETEIGRHLRRQKDDVERYRSDMTSVFNTLAETTSKNAHLCFVNSPSVVYGEVVDTNILLAECAAKANWRLLSSSATIGIPGPHHGMYASLKTRGASAPGQRGKQEHVLIFNRKQSN